LFLPQRDNAQRSYPDDRTLPYRVPHLHHLDEFCAHFAQFLSSLAFDKKTTALRRPFLEPTFVYRHRSISHLVIRMPVSSMTELKRLAGWPLGLGHCVS
jgi:hypothetical protein